MAIKKLERQSGVELLKILAIMIIVLCHTTQSLGDPSTEYAYLGYVLNQQVATRSIQHVVLTLFRYLGTLGNDIFFVCSAWFLCGDEKKSSSKKILQMVLDCWVISIVYLLIFLTVGGSLPFEINISKKDIIRSIFPTIFSNNWYIVCYMIFYAISPWLNLIISKMTKKELLHTDIIMGSLYYGIAYICVDAFFVNNLIRFIVMFFLVSYIKLYMNETFANIRVNYVLLIIGIGGTIGVAVSINYLGLWITRLGNGLLRWVNMSNPFLLMIAISSFHIFRKMEFRNYTINKVARLSLLVYLVHENLLIRSYFRPLIFYYIYIRFGYDYILIWDLLLFICTFLCSVLVSLAYSSSLQIVTNHMSKYFSTVIKFYENKFVNWFLRFN